MKPMRLDGVETIEQGDYAKLPAGGYVVQVTEVDDREDKEFLYLVFDIAEGEHKGFFGSDIYYRDKPNKHGIFLSYKQGMSDRALGMLKGKLKVFGDSNPGFDALAAWEAGKPELFVGKKVGIAAGMEEFVFQGREDGQWRKGESIDWFHARLKTPDEIRAGKYKVPDTRALSEEDKAKLAAYTGDTGEAQGTYEDIPFM